MNNRQDIDTIKERVDIVNLIGRHIELKPTGKNFSAKCPFHSEKTPSFVVNPEMQIYKCFGCGRSGDIFTFMMEHEHMSFPETLEYLAKEAGVQLKQRQKSENRFFSILEMLNRLTAQFFTDQLTSPGGQKAITYLHKRKFTDKSLETFVVGYAPLGNGIALLNHLKKKANFSEKQLMDSGLFKKKNGEIADKFRNRIMFPIKNGRGVIIAFTGRQMPNNEYGPKYLNSPETPLFRKKETVYGLYESKRFIREKDLCILCEGSTDVMACHQIGIKNIVAPLGTALTSEQLSLIKRYSDNILLLFDNDSAGQTALERGFILGTALGLNMYATNTGKFKDIGEVVEKEPKSVSEIVRTRQNCFSYLLTARLEEIDITKHAQYKKLIKYVGILLQNVQESADLDFFLNKAEKLTGKSKSIFLESVKDARNTSNSASKHKVSQEDYGNQTEKREDVMEEYAHHDFSVTNAHPKKLDLEAYLLGLLLHSEQYSLVKKINIIYFTNSDVIDILGFLIEKFDDDNGKRKLEDKFLSKHFHDNKNVVKLLEQIFLDNDLVHYSTSDETNTVFAQVYKRIQSQYHKVELSKLRRRLSIEEEKTSPNKQRIKRILVDIKEVLKLIN